MPWLLFAALRHFSLKALAGSLLEAFGALWFIVETSTFFSATAFSSSVKSAWWLFLLLGLVIGILRAWPRLSTSEVVSGTDCKITIRVADLFSIKDASLIIGTNTTFDTAMDDGTIDPKSVQGQLTKRLCNSREQLDRDIEASLAGIPATTPEPGEKPYGKQAVYEVGTVASVPVRGRNAYLVAVARLNAYKVAHASRRDVQDALPRLWEHIGTHGNWAQLVMPILGSGFSRIDGTREELVHEIIRSFVAAVRAGTFCRGLTVAISPRDFRESLVDLRRLRAFLCHECTYGSSARGALASPVIGVAQH